MFGFEIFSFLDARFGPVSFIPRLDVATSKGSVEGQNEKGHVLQQVCCTTQRLGEVPSGC